MTTSIGDVKTRIGAAQDRGATAMAGLSGVIAELEAWRAQLMAATAGSPQADVSHTIAAINRAIEHAREGQQVISAGMRMAEDVAARL